MTYEQRKKKPLPYRLKAWLIGILLLSGLIGTVTHVREIEHFVQLMRQAEPLWLILAVLLQVTTYFSVAAVWYQAMRHIGIRYSLLKLIPLGIAKLFSDQAMPSGGMSGTAFFIAALNKRGISPENCLAILLLSLVAYYAAYLIAAVTSVLLLTIYHAMHPWIIAVAVLFCLLAVAIPVSALWLRRMGRKELPPKLLRTLGLSNMLHDFGNASDELLRNPVLVSTTILLHGSIFLLDSATLWVMLHAVGQHVSFLVAFPSFVLASIVATLGPIPLGLGTFEVTSVTMLGVLGVPLEAALTSTLLLRGFTLWLPMLPGLWLAKRELH